MPKLKHGLLTRGALDKAAGAILGNWKYGIGATAGLPSSSKSMRSDDAAVCSHGGPSSASSRDSELRFRWGDDVLLLDVLSLPVSLAADIEEEEDCAVIFGTGHPSCGNCIGVNSSARRTAGRPRAQVSSGLPGLLQGGQGGLGRSCSGRPCVDRGQVADDTNRGHRALAFEVR